MSTLATTWAIAAAPSSTSSASATARSSSTGTSSSRCPTSLRTRTRCSDAPPAGAANLGFSRIATLSLGMRNRILGAIGVIWGGLILLGRLIGGSAGEGAGAYAAGQMTGLVFAVLLLVVGLYYLTRGNGSSRAKSR